jgi:tetratricopeptide (TPR) repeat protein
MALGMALAALAATLPLRWFTAGLLFKAGDARKDDPQPAVQVQGIPFYEEAVRAGLSGTQRVELYLYLGSLYNVAQRPDLAEHWFRECVRIYPDFLEAWYNLGYTAQSAYERSHAESDRQAALACYAKVLDIDPRAMNALNNSGNLAYTVGDLATAQSDFERLLKYQSGSLEAHYNLAAVFVRRGDKAQAEGELEKALQIKPDFDPAKKLLETLRALKGPLRAS